MRASRSFRSIIILFANASATRSCPGLLNFRMGLGYTSVRARASGGGRPRRTTDTGYGGCFPVSLTRRRFAVHFVDRYQMPIVHTSSIAPRSYGFVRSATR